MPSERLIFTDLQYNNNKYWHADLQGTTVSFNWGRVGADRGQSKVAVCASEEKAQRLFDSKVNEKLNKGYTRQDTLSENRPVSVAYVAKVQIKHNNDPETESLIDFLVQRNIHAIEGTTSIRLEAGKLTTPLGPVTNEGLDKAQVLLVSMAKYDREFNDIVNQYLRIIPRDIGRHRVDPMSLFGDERDIEREQATIDSLRVVVKDLEQKTVASDAPPIFQTRLDIVDAKDVDFKRIKKAFDSTLNKNHQSSALKLHRVWSMSIQSAADNFEAKLGNIRELWHGTKDANLLSILKNGYVIPKQGSGIVITGRMFGDGIYFSNQSTKSLNYASGYWGTRSARCFMLYNDVAMGKEYKPTRGFSGKVPKGYDSCFAEAGKSGVMNNEMIIYRTSQVNPKFLCEFQ